VVLNLVGHDRLRNDVAPHDSRENVVVEVYRKQFKDL
jgi:hypothetical protein